MWLKRFKRKAEPRVAPKERQALDGHAAALAVESLACEAVIIQSDPTFSEIMGPLKNLVPHVQDSLRTAEIRRVAELERLAGLVVGQSAAGLRASAFVGELAGIHVALRSAAGKRLPFVINLTGRALRRQAGPLHGGHDDYHAAADAGLFQMFANNVQEVVDFTLIAHRIAELALTPGLCAQDFYRTSQSVQDVCLPEPDLVLAYLGRPGDSIDAATPAQRILFGKKRRRIPRLIDPDHAVGIGGAQDSESFFRSVAAQRPFFAQHLEPIVEQAMTEFGELTERHYDKVSRYRSDDADIVVLAQGAVVEELQAVTDCLRDEHGIKAGVLNLTLLRPFPGAALTECLRGKQAVTVLERTDDPLAEDPPLLRELRGAIDRAMENGSAGGSEPPYPAYSSYRGPSDRPRIFSGIYGVGAEIPPFDELAAVFSNMLPDGSARRRFYVGPEFGRASRRFPHLQSLQQALDKAYPHRRELSLVKSDAIDIKRPCQALQIHSLSAQGALFAGNLFARLLAGALGWSVRTVPSGGLQKNLVPCDLILLHGDGDTRSRPADADTLLVSSDNLLEHVISSSRIAHGGMVIVACNDTAEALWAGLSRRADQWLRDHEVQLFALDARTIASEAASNPSFVNQLSIWALLGAYLKASGLPEEDSKRCYEQLLPLLGQVFEGRDKLVDEIAATLRRGAEAVAELPWQSLPAEERAPIGEPEPPWTVQSLEPEQETVFDRTRFWHSVGYLYNSGQADETLIDPFLATGVIPAGSSAHRDMTSYRLRIPEWLAENCTGCGLCWAHCPDSALPPTVQSLSAVIDTAVSECKQAGAAMTQMARITSHMVKLAHRLVSKDGLHQYLTMGPLLSETFAQLVEKMDLNEEVMAVLKEDFELLRATVESWPIARTETFFEAPDKAGKGSGMLLSIGLNPLSCKGCGLCIEICPEGAFAWAEQTEERVRTDRGNWAFQMKLPDVPDDVLNGCISELDAGSQVNRLLDKTVYHSMVGGDAAFPGTSTKTALHLLSSAIESVMLPRFKAHADRLSNLIDALQEKIQGKVSDIVRINDFDDFTARLSRLGDRNLTPENLGRVFEGDQLPQQVDHTDLTRMSQLITDLEAQRERYGPNGADRARMIMTLDPDGATRWSGTYPDNPHSSPWLSNTAGDATALAEGVFEGVTRRLAEELAACRLAEMELKGVYDSEKEAQLREDLGSRVFTPEEWDLIPPILVIGHAGATRWEDVARLLASSHPLRIAILDTNGIEVAGDGGSEEAVGASYGLLALAHGDAYVVQTSVGNPGHLIRGVTESLTRQRPALFQIHAPDPQASGISPEKVAEQAQRAVQSRAVPLFEFDPESRGATLNLDENPDTEADWSSQELTIKESSGTMTTLAPLTVADWAIHDMRFGAHFSIIAKGHVNEQMKRLADYVALEPAQREGLTPYIDVVDDEQRQFIATVSPAMVAATERSRKTWTFLRQLTAQPVAVPERTTAQPEPAPADVSPAKASPEAAAPAPAPDVTQHQELTENLLRLCGYGRDPEFFQQSLREFITKRDQARAEGERTDETPQ